MTIKNDDKKSGYFPTTDSPRSLSAHLLLLLLLMLIPGLHGMLLAAILIPGR
jgi:hypothetical protein